MQKDLSGKELESILDEILDILNDSEVIQNDRRQSAYTKEQAKISAYNEILEVLMSYEVSDCRRK